MRIIVALLFLVAFSSPAFAQTQTEMTRQACMDYTKADKGLNTAYAQLRKTCKSDVRFLARLKAAQQTWVKLRDAETDLLYPLGPTSGTAQPMLRCGNLTDLTQKRTAVLKQWNNDGKDGLICNDSNEMR